MLPPEHAQRTAALGEGLRRLRQGTSLRALSRSASVSKPTLLAIEGGGDAQLSTLLRLLDAHGRLAEFDAFVSRIQTAE